MALVNCPECGKENISDSASSCPNCGYGIAEHFRYEAEKANEMAKIPMPSVPKKKRGYIFTIILALIFLFTMHFILFGVFAVLSFMLWRGSESNYESDLYAYRQANKDIKAYKEKEFKKLQENKVEIHCPACGSTDVQKISVFQKSLELEMIGLSSNTLGKQHLCRKCKTYF